MDHKISRFYSFLVIGLIYFISFIISSILYYFTAGIFQIGVWLLCFEFGIILTVFVFIGSLIFNNASVYDPFWSVYPVFLIFTWVWLVDDISFSSQIIWLSASIMIWSVRLTLNWARGWKGLDHEDWRYSALREQSGKLYPLVNFFGIHLFPTILVSLGMLPALKVFFSYGEKTNALTIIAFALCIIAAMIELIADEQQRTFKRNRATEKEFIQSGLWSYSRHPNYFGEVLFWWGIYLFAIAANPQYWWTIIGAIAMTMLFLFISIPMMEKHMSEKRPDYSNYQRSVSRFIPWIPKKFK